MPVFICYGAPGHKFVTRPLYWPPTPPVICTVFKHFVSYKIPFSHTANWQLHHFPRDTETQPVLLSGYTITWPPVLCVVNQSEVIWGALGVWGPAWAGFVIHLWTCYVMSVYNIYKFTSSLSDSFFKTSVAEVYQHTEVDWCTKKMWIHKWVDLLYTYSYVWSRSSGHMKTCNHCCLDFSAALTPIFKKSHTDVCYWHMLFKTKHRCLLTQMKHTD